MNWFESYIAIIKGYVGAGILFLPKSFSNGGMIWSSFVLCFSGWITTLCAMKLIRIGQKMNCYCYSQIVKKSFGNTGKQITDLMISLSQLCFTIA